MIAHFAVIAMAAAIAHAVAVSVPQHGYAAVGHGGQVSSYGGYGEQAAYGGHAVVAQGGGHGEHIVDHYAPPKYQFEYSVEDKHTGDVKSHHEERDGDVTRGYYTVHEPDGTVRTVKYTVDKHSGFNAVVEKTGHASHPEAVAHRHQPIVHHQPIVQHQPIVHHQPIVQHQPIAHQPIVQYQPAVYHQPIAHQQPVAHQVVVPQHKYY